MTRLIEIRSSNRRSELPDLVGSTIRYLSCLTLRRLPDLKSNPRQVHRQRSLYAAESLCHKTTRYHHRLVGYALSCSGTVLKSEICEIRYGTSVIPSGLSQTWPCWRTRCATPDGQGPATLSTGNVAGEGDRKRRSEVTVAAWFRDMTALLLVKTLLTVSQIRLSQSTSDRVRSTRWPQAVNAGGA